MLFACASCYNLNLNYVVKTVECGHWVTSDILSICTKCAVEQLKCQRCGSLIQKEDFPNILQNCSVKKDGVKLTEDSLTIEFEQGLTLMAAVKYGEYVNRTQMSINGYDLVNK